MQTIGTCGHCGGPVQVPEFWGGSVPPVPTCARCKAEAANPYGATIPMKPRQTRDGKPIIELCGETIVLEKLRFAESRKEVRAKLAKNRNRGFRHGGKAV